MFILQFLFVIVLVVLFFFLAVVATVVFGFWNTIKQVMGKRPGGRRQDFGSKPQGPTISGGKPRTSDIDKNEGEYVDYEVLD